MTRRRILLQDYTGINYLLHNATIWFDGKMSAGTSNSTSSDLWIDRILGLVATSNTYQASYQTDDGYEGSKVNNYFTSSSTDTNACILQVNGLRDIGISTGDFTMGIIVENFDTTPHDYGYIFGIYDDIYRWALAVNTSSSKYYYSFNHYWSSGWQNFKSFTILDSDMHVFIVKRTSGVLTYFLDGEKYATSNTDTKTIVVSQKNSTSATGLRLTFGYGLKHYGAFVIPSAISNTKIGEISDSLLKYYS